MAPIGTVCIFEFLEEYILNKKENIIPIHELSKKCLLNSNDIEKSLEYLISTGWIKDFEKTKKYGGLVYEIKGFRGGIKDFRHLLEIKFDYDSKTLFLWDTSIEIGKSANNIPCDLLKTLFEKPMNVWNNDEILNDWHRFNDEAQNSLKAKQIYQAGMKINKIIKNKTHIDDFILITTKTAQINPKYIN